MFIDYITLMFINLVAGLILERKLFHHKRHLTNHRKNLKAIRYFD
jgi:hypothetical protein